MRMRLLGEGPIDGHSVCFFAADEVHIDIASSMRGGLRTPSSLDVIRWAINNTVHAIKDGLFHWAAQGASFCDKQLAFSHCAQRLPPGAADPAMKSNAQLRSLGQMCKESEPIELLQFYGQERAIQAMPCIVKKRLDGLQNTRGGAPCEFAERIVQRCANIGTLET
jgi:hypothetical protein